MVVLFSSFIAFWPALDAKFIMYDDQNLFLENQSFRGLGWPQVKWAFTTTLMGHYQPLTWLSSSFDYVIGGLDSEGRPDPHPFHFHNIVLHSANALLFYFVALRLLSAALMQVTPSRLNDSGESRIDSGQLSRSEPPRAMLCWGAAAAALLFGIHPLRVESVAWATERRDVLSSFFLLAATLAYLRAFPPRTIVTASFKWYAASIVLLVLSLLSKAWGMTFVAVSLVLDIYPLRRLPADIRLWLDRPYRQIWLSKFPYLVLGIAAAAMAAYAQGTSGAMVSLRDMPLVLRLTQACFGLVYYVTKLVWPWPLVIFVDIPTTFNPLNARYLSRILVAIFAVVAVLLLRRKWPALAAAAAIYAMTVAPVLGLVQSGPQLVAARYSYVSCMSWAVLMGGWVPLAWRRQTSLGLRAALTGIMIVILGAYSISTWRQATIWQSDEVLWAHEIAFDAPSAQVNFIEGSRLAREGRDADAIAYFRRALELNDRKTEAWYNMANALRRLNRFGDAEGAYRRAIETSPTRYIEQVNLGNMYMLDLDRLDDAITIYREAVSGVDALPSNERPLRPYLALGIALKRKGRTKEAGRMLRLAESDPLLRPAAEAELATLSDSSSSGPAGGG